MRPKTLFKALYWTGGGAMIGILQSNLEEINGIECTFIIANKVF